MSKSMYWTKSKTANNVINEHDNIVTFLRPIGRGEYTTGQTIQTLMLPYSAINLIQIDISNVLTTIAYCDYTPLSPNSQIIIDFFTTYSVSGNSSTAGDSFVSALKVGSTAVGKGFQQWLGAAGPINGTGTRSGTIFPLMGAYTNRDLTTKRISVTLNKGTFGDDTVTVYADEGTWLKITEVAL
jgi:hypothetical protein